MARTQMSKRGIADHTLTGASFRSELEIYDETTAYIIGEVVLWKNGSWEAQASIPSGPEGDLSNTPDNNLDWKRIKAPKYNVYPSSTQTFNNIPVTIILDTERAPDDYARMTLDTNNVVFNFDERVIISAEVAVDGTSNARAEANGYLEISTDGGTIWNVIPNSEMWIYSRNDTDGKGSGSTTIPVDVNIGDRLRVQIVVNKATNLTTVPAGCNITIFTTVGGSGPRGQQGNVGPTGDLNWKGDWSVVGIYSTRETVYYLGSTYTSTTNGNTEVPSIGALNWDLVALKGTDGTGSTIIVADEGVIQGTFGTIDFIGDNITITDAGSSVATATVLPTKQSYMIQLWAEENSGLGTDTYEWAFGNGANTPQNRGVPIYIPSGYIAEIVSVGLTINDGTATIDTEIDGVSTGASCTTTFATNPSNVVEVTPFALSNNTRLNFKTTTAIGTSGPCVASCWIKYTEQ